MSETAIPRPGQRRKTIEEVVPYAISHRTRVHILIVLNEGTFTPGQIAEVIGEPLNNVSNHIRELADAGSIELAKKEQVRNTILHYYRAVEMPFYSDEEIAAMPPAATGASNSGAVVRHPQGAGSRSTSSCALGRRRLCLASMNRTSPHATPQSCLPPGRDREAQ